MRFNKHIKSKLLLLFYKSIQFCDSILFKKIIFAISKWISKFVFYLLSKQKLKHKIKKFLNVDDKQTNRIVKKLFENFSYLLIEECSSRRDKYLMKKIYGLEILDKTIKEFKKAILTMPHLSNWEIAAESIAKLGYKIAVIYQPNQDKALNLFFISLRTKLIKWLPVGKSAIKDALKILRQEGLIAMVPDIPYGEDGMFVNILNHKIKIAKGPFLLAVRTKSPIIPGYVIRDDNQELIGYIEKPIIPQTDRYDEILKIADEWVKSFEKYLKKYPDLWINFKYNFIN